MGVPRVMALARLSPGTNGGSRHFYDIRSSTVTQALWERDVKKRFRATGAAAAAGALVVLVLLFPTGGNDSDPPECFSAFGYVVPCGLGPEQAQGPGFALAGAVLAAVLVGVGSFVGGRERRSVRD